jgi:hypothetical protein
MWTLEHLGQTSNFFSFWALTTSGSHIAVLLYCQPASTLCPGLLPIGHQPASIYADSLPFHCRGASTLLAHPKCHCHHPRYHCHHHYNHHCHHPSPILAEPLYLSVSVIRLFFILKSFSFFLLPSVHLKYVIFVLTQFMYPCIFLPMWPHFLHFLPMRYFLYFPI